LISKKTILIALLRSSTTFSRQILNLISLSRNALSYLRSQMLISTQIGGQETQELLVTIVGNQLEAAIHTMEEVETLIKEDSGIIEAQSLSIRAKITVGRIPILEEAAKTTGMKVMEAQMLTLTLSEEHRCLFSTNLIYLSLRSQSISQNNRRNAQPS